MQNNENFSESTSNNLPDRQPIIVASPQKFWKKSIILFVVALFISAISLFIGLEIGKNEEKNVFGGKLPIVRKTVGNIIKSDTSSWKTYRNNVVGFQFQYPDDFTLNNASADSLSISNDLPPDPACVGGGCHLGTIQLAISFVHLSDKSNVSINDLAQEMKDSVLNNFPDQDISIETMQKFGMDTRYFEGVGLGYFQNYILKLSSGESFVIEVRYPSKEGVAEFQDLANQILSTVEFISLLPEGNDAESISTE